MGEEVKIVSPSNLDQILELLKAEFDTKLDAGGSQTSTSTADGGNNVYTFGDGSTLTVKNGNKGTKGDKGDKGDPGENATTTTVATTTINGLMSAADKTKLNGIATGATKNTGKLTIGSYVFDGSADVTIPVYNGE